MLPIDFDCLPGFKEVGSGCYKVIVDDENGESTLNVLEADAYCYAITDGRGGLTDLSEFTKSKKDLKEFVYAFGSGTLLF